MAWSVMQEICYLKERVKLIDFNIPSIWDLYPEHSHGLWSWKKVLGRSWLGLQLYSGGMFIPSRLSSAVGSIWPSYSFALPAQCLECFAAVCVSGQVLAWKGNGGRGRDKGLLHTRGRSGPPAPLVTPCPAVLQDVWKRGTVGHGRDLPHPPCGRREEKSESWVSISPDLLISISHTEKTRNHDSENGSYRWPGATKRKRNDTNLLLPGSCQLLVPNSDVQYSELKYSVLCYVTELCMEREKNPIEQDPQHGRIHSHWTVGWFCLDVCQKLVSSYHCCLWGESYFVCTVTLFSWWNCISDDKLGWKSVLNFWWWH